MSKIHFTVSDVQEVLDTLLRTMQNSGGKLKHGTARRSPPFQNERELQQLVDQLAKIVISRSLCAELATA